MASSFQDPHLQSILVKIARKEGFEQPKFEISAGSKPGDNYVGRIFRTVISEQNGIKSGKTLSLIFKASPLSKIRKEKMCTDDAFHTESEVYQTVLPALNKLLHDYGINNSDTFPGTVRCLDVQLNGLHSENCDVIVLEDKRIDGFRMLMSKNAKSLDAEHCRHVLRKLAVWHAASFALNHYHPETAERLRNTVTKENNLFCSENHPLLFELKKSALETLKMLKEPYKKGNKLYEKLENTILNFNAEIVKANTASPDLLCLVHGDCWYNNVLFKYNEDGSLEDACLLDLQFVRVTSPAVELSYFIFECTTKEVRDAHYDELIRFYHDEVSSHLKKMACDPGKIFPWKTLQEHLMKFSRLGVLISISSIPINLADSSDVIVGVNSGKVDGDVFAGSVKVTDPERLEEISKRVTDIVDDAFRWKYL